MQAMTVAEHVDLSNEFKIEFCCGPSNSVVVLLSCRPANRTTGKLSSSLFSEVSKFVIKDGKVSRIEFCFGNVASFVDLF